MMFGLFKKKREVKKCCQNCRHYNRVNVPGNRMDTVSLGLCQNPKVRTDCVPFGRTGAGFYRWDWPADQPYGPISFDPEFLCKHYDEKR